MSKSPIATITRSQLSRRALVGGFGAFALAATLEGCSSPGSGATAAGSSEGTLSGSVIWADYGGPTNESRQIAYFDSFDSEKGVEVVSASLEDAVANQMLEGGTGDYDVVQISSDSFYKYKDNLVALPDGVAVGDTLDEALQPYAIGAFTIGIAQGWLTDTFADGGPTSWADFFDIEAFPGNRAWPGSPGSYDASFEIALLADGVEREDLYPLDFERATAKLDTLRSSLVYYTSYPEVQTLLTTGSAAIAVSVTGQFSALINAGMEVTVQWDGAFLSPNFFVVPKEAPNQANSFALADWMADPERQAVFTERTFYGPSNAATFDLLSEDVIARLPNSPDKTATLVFDEQWRADNLDEIVQQYTDWLSQ